MPVRYGEKFDAKLEVDEIIGLYPDEDLSFLIESLQKYPGGYSGTPQQVAAVLAEMKRRVDQDRSL